MDFEDISKKVGGCGIYHYITFFLLSLPTFKQAIDLQGLTFALHDPVFKCDTSSIKNEEGMLMYTNFTVDVSPDQCTYRMNNKSIWNSCKKWIYENETFGDTLITDFDLVCSKENYRNLIFTIFFTSELFGYPISILSDKIGRRYILISFLYSSIPITIGQVLSKNLYVQIFLVFLSGATKSIYISLAFTTLSEIMPLEKFDLAVSNFWMFYSLGYMSTAAFAYLSRSWRMIYLYSLIFSVFYLLYLCFVPETPRWLMLNGKKGKSFRIMSFMAKVNNHILSRKEFDKWNPIVEETGNILSLFRYKRMIGRCLILMFAASAFSFAYIGSSTDLTFASSNIFISTFVMGFVEIPTGPIAALTAKMLNRKTGIICLCSFGIVCLVAMPFIEADLSKSIWQPWVKMVLAMGGKLGFTSAWCLFDVITYSSFPTTIRNGSMSFIYISIGIGSIVAPVVNNLANKWHFAAPCLIYSTLLIITIILVKSFLPETKNLPLPQTIEEAASLENGKERQWQIRMLEDSEKRLNYNNVEESF